MVQPVLFLFDYIYEKYLFISFFVFTIVQDLYHLFNAVATFFTVRVLNRSARFLPIFEADLLSFLKISKFDYISINSLI